MNEKPEVNKEIEMYKLEIGRLNKEILGHQLRNNALNEELNKREVLVEQMESKVKLIEE